MSKEALVIVLDVGQSMGYLQENSGMTGLDKAKAAFRLMIQQKLLFGYKQDMCGVILFNSKNTKNACHDDYGGYESIEEYFELNTPNLDLLECIDNVQCNKNGINGDALDALLVAAQIIINFVGKKKYRKRIFMITDASTSINDIEQIQMIANSFIDENISFNCIGIGFDDDNDDDDDDEVIDKIDNNSDSKRIIKYFSHLVCGSIFNAKSAISMMSELRSKSVLMRPTYSGKFKITTKIQIECKIYCRCREQTLPSLKKESMIGVETKKISMDRLYKNKFRGNEDDEEVEEDERVKSYLYGKERIPFNENDELRLNYKSGEKHFECLGFINKDKIKRQQFMGPTSIVIADPGSNAISSQLSLSSFIHSCHEKNVYILCRLVSRKNASPKLVVLQPRIKTQKELFILNELPFYEDIRKFPFASFNINKSYIPNKSQIEAAKNLINSLNLMEANIDEDGDKMEALRPQQTFNPILQRFYQNLQHRALDSQSKLQNLDPLILKYLEPDPILFNNENTKKCIKEFENLFPTKLIPKKQVKKERKHWNDISDELDNLFDDVLMNDNNDNDNNHNKKEEDEEDEEDEEKEEKDDMDIDLDLDSLIVVNEIKQIGTTNPIQDFNYLLNKKTSSDLFNKLSISFWNIINQLIDTSYNDLNYDKAAKCIIHLKQISIKEEEPILFNKELTKFKLKYKEKKKKLWNLVINKNINLICIDDFDLNQVVDGLNITKQESKDFLNQEIKQNQKEINIKNDDDDDDIFDDLM